MSLESVLEDFPKNLRLRSGFECLIRPLEASDESAFHTFFTAIPERERMVVKHRVTDRAVIREWCAHIDYGRNLPLLAFADDRVAAAATLHQQLGGWKRHVGRVSVLVHPEYRGRGVGRALISELIDAARHMGLEKVEAEFIGEQTHGMGLFASLGFTRLLLLEDYVKDMQAIPHDYILMGLSLVTDEEYAGMG